MKLLLIQLFIQTIIGFVLYAIFLNYYAKNDYLFPDGPFSFLFTCREFSQALQVLRGRTQGSDHQQPFFFNMIPRTAGSERSASISTITQRRGTSHAKQCPKNRLVASFRIRCKYSSKHPCPVSTCITLDVMGNPPPSNLTSQFGRTASMTLSPGALSYSPPPPSATNRRPRSITEQVRLH